MNASDFDLVGPTVDGESAFRERVTALAINEHESLAQKPRDLAPGGSTPWGPAQQSKIFAAGVTYHETASHEGYQLDARRNTLVHAAYRNSDGWYEGDAEWAKVAVTFPALLPVELETADETLRENFSEAYEAVNRVEARSARPQAKRDTPPRTATQERAAMRQLDLPSYAAEKHGYAIEWRDGSHRRATLRKDDEELVANKDKEGAWSYDSRTKGGDHGDILDFEIHRGAKSLATARRRVGPELARADHERSLSTIDGSVPLKPDTLDPDDPHPSPSHRDLRGRGR